MNQPYIQSYFGENVTDTVQLFKPWYGEKEYDALRRPLETGWLGYGPLSRKFEKSKSSKLIQSKLQ